jgi:acetyl esterase/lipase
VAPAIVITAECDVLHYDGERYADALRRAGVPACRSNTGVIHAFFGMVPAVDNAMNAQHMVWAAFKRAFAQA